MAKYGGDLEGGQSGPLIGWKGRSTAVVSFWRQRGGGLKWHDGRWMGGMHCDPLDPLDEPSNGCRFVLV